VKTGQQTQKKKNARPVLRVWDCMTSGLGNAFWLQESPPPPFSPSTAGNCW